jgi:DNA-binding transcriptional MerR regulator
MSSPVRMKISELSRRSGVTVATIKYYRREGLLPPAELTLPNQATYGEEHLERLATIRTLHEVAHLKIAGIRAALKSIDQPGLSAAAAIDGINELIGSEEDRAHPAAGGAGGDRVLAAAEVARFLEMIGWRVDPASSVRQRLEEVFLALRATFDPEIPIEAFWPYAKAIEPIAKMEIGYYWRDLTSGSTARAVQAAVTGTILWEHVLTALRRAAHEHFLAEGAGGTPAGGDPMADPDFARLLPPGYDPAAFVKPP